MTNGNRDTQDVIGVSALAALLVAIAALGFWIFGFSRPTLFLFGLLPVLAIWGVSRLVGKRKASDIQE